MFTIPGKFAEKVIMLAPHAAKVVYTTEHYCEYELSYIIDVVKMIAISHGYSVKITVSAEYDITNPNQAGLWGGVAKFPGFDSEVLADAIQRNANNQKTMVSSLRTNVERSVVVFSDATAGMDNKWVSYMRKHPDQAAFFLPVEKRLVGKKHNPNSPLLKKLPVASISMVPVPDSLASPQGPSQALALASIFEDGISPATVANIPRPIIGPFEAMQGLSAPPKTISKISSSSASDPKGYGEFNISQNLQPAFINKTSKPGKSIMKMSKMLQTAAAPKRNSLADLQSRVQVVLEHVPQKFKKITKRIRVPWNKILGAERLLFKLELPYQSAAGTTVSLSRVVNHTARLERYRTPKQAPSISAMAVRAGINVVSVRQVDPMATSVIIKRKTLNTAKEIGASGWEYMNRVELKSNAGEIKVTDVINNFQTCLYVAIAEGVGGLVSSDFDSALTKALPLPVPRIPIDQSKFSYVSIFAHTVSKNKVQVLIANIPPGPIRIYVTATDKTAKCPTNFRLGHCRLVGSPSPTSSNSQVRDAGKGHEIIFNDDKVKNGHTYEYNCIMIYPSGKEIKSRVPVLHTYYGQMGKNVEFQVSSPKASWEEDATFEGTVIDRPHMHVSFSVEANFTDGGLNEIVDSMTQAGISSDFVAEVQDQKEGFQDLLRCEVERLDILTGETETFGVQPIGTFTDSAMTRAIAGVSPLRPGSKYRYVVRLLRRSALGLLGGDFESVDEITLQKYRVKVAKFLSPMALEKSTLPSNASSMGISKVSGIVPQDPFLQGVTGLELIRSVVIPGREGAKIVNVRGDVSNGENRVRWEVEGNIARFDHFLVYAEYQGTKYIAGKVHNGIGTSQAYMFVDVDFGDRPGSVIYTVMPVYRDFSYGAESTPVALEIFHPSSDTQFWAAPKDPANWGEDELQAAREHPPLLGEEGF